MGRPDGIPFAVEELICLLNRVLRLTDEFGRAQHLGQGEASSRDLVQTVRAVCEPHDLLREFASLVNRPPLCEELRLERPQNQLSALVIACRVRPRHRSPLLSLVDATLPEDRLGEFGRPDSQVRSVMSAFEVLTLFAERLLGGGKVDRKQLDVSSHGPAVDHSRYRSRAGRRFLPLRR